MSSVIGRQMRVTFAVAAEVGGRHDGVGGGAGGEVKAPDVN